MNIASTLQTTLSTTVKKALGATLLGATLLFAPGLQTTAHAGVFFSVSIAPPAIPVYEQPLCPGDGYIWTPGYWAWTDDGYQWIDGAWVTAPYVGALWTPGYWGYNGGAYLWNAGYWGREVGYYGGINYGFGYFGTGFYGGYWGGDRFVYNRAYNRFDRGFRGSLYDRREGNFDGRPGGAAFVRNDRGFHDDHRGSFVGARELHDDHREAFNGNRPNGSNVDQQRGFSLNNQQRGFAQNNARPGYNGIQSQQPSQGFSGNRNGFQNDANRQPPQQGFTGYQNPNGNHGGAYNNQQITRPAPEQNFNGNRGFQSNAIRSSNTPAMTNNGGGRGFAGSNSAPAAPPQGGSFHGGAPSTNQGGQGGNQGGGFHGGDNRGSHR